MDSPAWQAVTANATASIVLPTPGGPSRATLDLAWTNSKVARSRTLRASRPGWNAKSNWSRALWCGSPDGFSPLDELGEGVGEVGESEPGGMVTDPVSGQGAHEFSFGLARLA